jgi:hypothetical protein
MLFTIPLPAFTYSFEEIIAIFFHIIGFKLYIGLHTYAEDQFRAQVLPA